MNPALPVPLTELLNVKAAKEATMPNNSQFRSGGGAGVFMNPCSCCAMSRRSFLGSVTACTAALTAGGGGLVSLRAAPQSKEVIDIASFRPRPNVRVMSVVARQKPPYWLGWPGTSYDVEGERARYAKAITEAGTRVGV